MTDRDAFKDAIGEILKLSEENLVSNKSNSPEKYAKDVAGIIYNYFKTIIYRDIKKKTKYRWYDNMITLYVIAINSIIKVYMDSIPCICKLTAHYIVDSENQIDYILYPSNNKIVDDQDSDKAQFDLEIQTNIEDCNKNIELYINDAFLTAKREVEYYKNAMIIEFENLKMKKYVGGDFFKILSEIGKSLIDASFSNNYRAFNPGYRVYETIHSFIRKNKKSLTLIRDSSNSIIQYYDMFYELLNMFKILSISEYDSKLYSDDNALMEDENIKESINRIRKIWNHLDHDFYNNLLFDKPNQDDLYIKLREIFPSDIIMSDGKNVFNPQMVLYSWPKRRLHVAGTNIYYISIYGDTFNYDINFKNFLRAVVKISVLRKPKEQKKMDEDKINTADLVEVFFTSDELKNIFDVKESIKHVYERICENHLIDPDGFDGFDKETSFTERLKIYNNKDFGQTIPSKDRLFQMAVYAHALPDELDNLLEVAGYLLSDSIVADKFAKSYFIKAQSRPEMYDNSIWCELCKKLNGN